MKDAVKKVIIEWQEGRAANIRRRDMELVYSEGIVMMKRRFPSLLTVFQ